MVLNTWVNIVDLCMSVWMSIEWMFRDNTSWSRLAEHVLEAQHKVLWQETKNISKKKEMVQMKI